MLQSIYQRSRHVHRLRGNALGAMFDPLVEHLLRRGNAHAVIHRYVRAVEHYGDWLRTRTLCVTADQVTRASVREFVEGHLPGCSCGPGVARDRSEVLAALNHLLRVLSLHDPVAPGSPASVPV